MSEPVTLERVGRSWDHRAQPHEAHFDIQLLGTVQAFYEGQPLRLGGVQSRSLLAVLLLHPGQVVPKRRLVEYVWGTDAPATAGDVVAAYVSRLRGAFAPTNGLVKLVSVQPGFRAEVDPAFVDAHRFTALLNRARADLGGQEDGLAAVHLRDALAQWGENASALADAKSDWLRVQAEALEGRRLDALELLARIELDANHPAEAAELLRDVAPLRLEREIMTVTLVRALMALGEMNQAAQLSANASRALVKLGREPGRDLREAQTAVMGRQPSLPAAPSGPQYQLPADTGTFMGRERELAELLEIEGAARTGERRGAVVISAIDGMAGIGKTALAIHAAHRLAERYPGGQLFLDLHGHTEGRAPRNPSDALASLLQSYGVPPSEIPADLDALAGMYRNRLAGTRTLVLLDNAASEAQVRPLLPGDSGCLVLVTSRRRLKSLDDAHALSLDVLPGPDALSLFRQVAGPSRTETGDPSIEEIVELCGRLPLALRIAAAVLRNRPTWTAAHLAVRLREGRDRLASFSDGDRNLTSMFDLTYQNLGEDQQRAFRLLGLVPGPSVDIYAAAALLNEGLADTDRLVQELADGSLLSEPEYGRYQMHDLLREYARAWAALQDPSEEREAAIDRLLEYYAHTARTASDALARYPRSGPDGSAPALRDADAARNWLRTEYPNLDAAFTYAHTHYLHHHIVNLAAAMAEILINDGPWPRALDIHQAAADAAAHLNKSTAHANALNDLGRVRHLTGDYAAAADAHAQALEIYQRLGMRTDTERVPTRLTDLKGE